MIRPFLLSVIRPGYDARMGATDLQGHSQGFQPTRRIRMIPADPRAVNLFAMLSITVGSLFLVACGTSSPPAAVANEVFGGGIIELSLIHI